MLRGYVDQVSSTGILGWAANSAAPDSVAEVSIFVNDAKVAQLACDLYRSDLKKQGFGEGRHGFRYDFPVALDETVRHKIVVRFAKSDQPLRNGEILLASGVASPIATQEEKPAQEAKPANDPKAVRVNGPGTGMRLRAPSDQRELFKLFALFESAHGIRDFVGRLDLRDWTMRHAHYAALGRLAKTSVTPGIPVSDYLVKLLVSDEFQESIIPSLLRAYPEKRRLLFVHIPKCAGTDLTEQLRCRYASLDVSIKLLHWTDKDSLFRQIHEFVELMRFSDTIFLRGHMRLSYYLDHELGRPSDRLFSIMREPIDIALSQVNYVMTRIRQDLQRKRIDRDTQGWLKFLGIEKLPDALSDDYSADLWKKILYNKNLVIPNSMCHWLGGGDSHVVLQRLAQCDAELTDTVRYSRWLSERWHIDSSSRHNESIKFVTAGDLSAKDRDYLRDISSEDVKLFAVLQSGLKRTGGASIMGSELPLE